MFMMTTKLEGRNEQPTTKDKHFSFNSHRIVDYNHPTDFVNPNFREDSSRLTIGNDDYNVHTKPMRENYGKLSLPTGKQLISNPHHHQDEGYNTDSKSNTSPSTTSPLSSSFSSMSTFDGSFHSPTSPSSGGVVSPNSYNSNHTFTMHGNTQRGPTSIAPPPPPPPQKPSLIQGNGKIHVNRHALIMAKKKDSPQETHDNQSANLEDRLRALTTIEEEEPGISNVSTRETYKKQVYISPETEVRNSHHTQPIMNDGNGEEHGRIRGQQLDQTSGFFRAVPVEIGVVPQHPSYDQMKRVEDRNGNNIPNYRSANHDDSRQIPHHPQQNSNDKNWYDYRRYFEKDCDIPLHNIDALNRGKFINAGLDNANDKDINRHLRTNPTDARGDQLNENIQQRFGGENRDFTNGGFQEHPSQGRTTPRGQFHGYPQNGQRIEENGNNQNMSSASMSDLRYSYTHPTSHARNDNSYHSDNHPRFQPEQTHSNPPQFHHNHQQHQYDNQPHYQTNQYQQHHPFYNEQSQQNPDPSFLNSHNGPAGSYNSLPRHYEDQRQHPSMFYSGDPNQFSENDVVLRRSWASSSTRAIPDRVDRFSWHPESSRSQQPTPTSNDRYSLDLGNIPQLQQQIRATSEMCLQASKRHKFASSADIYKLFQGQKKPAAPPTSSSSSAISSSTRGGQGQIQSHRHSFHALPGGSWTRSQQNLHDHTHHSRDSTGAPLRQQHGLFSLNHSSHPSPSPGPLRGDHSILIPQTSWATSSSSNSNTFLHPNGISSSTFPLTLSEMPHIQRQSSGYSSENELQQIELNAKAAKKSKIRTTPYSQQGGIINADQEFVPVDPTQDHDSSSSIIENEPVYVNQPMLAIQRGRSSITKSSPSQQSQLSTPPPPPLPARPQHLLQQTPVLNSNGYDATSNYPRTQHVNLGVENHNMSNKRNSTSPAIVITQKQIINFNQKPVTINSYVPNHTSSYNSNTNNTNDQTSEGRPILPGEQFPSLQPLDFQSNHDQYNPIEQKAASDLYLNPPKRSNSSRSNRTNSSPCTPLSPLEIAQALDSPFSTNVISDECGDRLSTLV